MATEWIYRSVLIVAAADRAAADGVASNVCGSDQTGTFSVALSADGTEPATHYGCYSAVTVEMLERMRDALMAGTLPSLLYYRLDAAEETLVATNSATAEIGAAWGWPASIADAGLMVVHSTI